MKPILILMTCLALSTCKTWSQPDRGKHNVTTYNTGKGLTAKGNTSGFAVTMNQEHDRIVLDTTHGIGVIVEDWDEPRLNISVMSRIRKFRVTNFLGASYEGDPVYLIRKTKEGRGGKWSYVWEPLDARKVSLFLERPE